MHLWLRFLVRGNPLTFFTTASPRMKTFSFWLCVEVLIIVSIKPLQLDLLLLLYLLLVLFLFLLLLVVFVLSIIQLYSLFSKQ